MALPVSNTTCDIYRSTSPSPPNPPDVADVPCYFSAKGASTLTTPYYTHKLLIGPDVDIRDDYTPGSMSAGANCDRVYVPDQTSPTYYRVLLVRRVGRGTALDHKECLLQRVATTWPSDDV